MADRLRSPIAPAYLLLCLILGGSAQGVWANMALQLIGLVILTWAALAPVDEPATRHQAQLLLIAIAALTLVALQLVPLPPSLWQSLGGRGAIVDGYRVLGIGPHWMPLSVAPYETAATVLKLIPPLALLAAMIRGAYRASWLLVALLAGVFAGIMLGALQVGSADPQNSPWYPYSESNFGAATGFFANANHMASLLVVSIPFLAAALAAARSRGRNLQRYSAVIASVAGAALVVAVGLAINGSLAGYGLAVPVTVASVLIILPKGSSAIRWSAVAAGLLSLAVLAALLTSPLQTAGLRSSAASSVTSREEIFRTSAKAAAQFMPLGSGAGTFGQVYLLTEDHDRLDPNVYVNHAHNDYLELALETGLPGILLIALFLAWWGMAAVRAWTIADAGPYARAAAIASAAVLVHSIVDFPLRTAAIGACFTMCLGLMSQRRKPPAQDKSELWPTRHVAVG